VWQHVVVYFAFFIKKMPFLMPFYTKRAQNLHKMHNGFLWVTEDSKNPIYTKIKKPPFRVAWRTTLTYNDAL
jgi:hypothetical protein